MEHVIRETAKRLADAGFPQPAPERGQIWYSESGAKYRIHINNNDGTVDYLSESDIVYLHLCRFLEADNCVFAPTAMDILKELPGCGLSFEADTWVAYTDQGTYRDPEIVSFVHKNPADACAAAWFYENKKT